MNLNHIETRLTEELTENLKHASVTKSVSPRPRFHKKVAHFVRGAFRSILQTTRPQRHWSGGLQNRLQAQNKIEATESAGGGGSAVQNNDFLLIHKL